MDDQGDLCQAGSATESHGGLLLGHRILPESATQRRKQRGTGEEGGIPRGGDEEILQPPKKRGGDLPRGGFSIQNLWKKSRSVTEITADFFGLEW